MTTQDVIDVLESHCPDETSEFGEAIVFAVMILKRDMPKRVMQRWNGSEIQYICPTCKEVLFGSRFCDCGQRLDWEE